ncbi:hypothetical protein HJ176_07680 [Vibrio parahaemolyticus]|nr:hypothetical protein [Vibrio parahaemolyticus]
MTLTKVSNHAYSELWTYFLDNSLYQVVLAATFKLEIFKVKVRKYLTGLMAVFLSFQVLATEFTVAGLLSDGYEIKSLTKSNYDSLVILQKKTKHISV